MRFLQTLFICILFAITLPVYSEDAPHTIEIRTRFSSFVGKPSWLLIIRDIDRGESYPYFFDVQRGENYWAVPTHGHNYLITVSNLRIITYDAYDNQYKKYEVKDFCHLESRGRVIHGKSALITIDGRLSKNTNGYRCTIQWW